MFLMNKTASRGLVLRPWEQRPRPLGLPEFRPLPIQRHGLEGLEGFSFRKLAPPRLRDLKRPSRILRAPRAPWKPNHTPWRPDLRGLDGFSLKKVFKKVASNVKSVSKKVTKAVKKAVKSVGKFVKKNAKWIVLAAAVAVTIYSMGGAAGIAAKLAKAGTWIKESLVAAGKWTAAKASSCMSGIKALLGGKKVGELQPQEVEALATANQDAGGQEIIPNAITALFGQKNAMPLGEDGAGNTVSIGDRAAMNAAGGQEVSADELPTPPPPPPPASSMPSWVLPVGIGAAALVLVLAMKK